MDHLTQIDAERTDSLLAALGEHLAADNVHLELVVVGGSALLALGLVDRVTRDVDVVALREDGELRSAEPFPEALSRARDRVARDFSLPADWLNAGPADLLHFGLPEGFDERLTRRWFGPAPTVHFASRLDQIHFKLYAMVDQGPGRHEADLRALAPTVEELHAAALWTRTHDPSLGFRSELILALRHLGVEDVDVDD